MSNTSKKGKTPEERIFEINRLLSHPAGVCKVWESKLSLELNKLKSESKNVTTKM